MSQSTTLLSSRLLARNVIWNLMGVGLPLVLALWAIPCLIRGMGTDRFGLLGIIWAGIGYFSLFDFGLGAALAKLTAERLGKGETRDIPSLLKTGLGLLLALGIFAMLLLVVLVPWLTESIFTLPIELKHEAKTSLWILAATLPFVTMTSGLNGVLRAYQRFDQINIIRIPLGIANFLFPVLALQITPSLTVTTALLALSRIISCLACFYFCRPHLLSQNHLPIFNRKNIKELLGFGGWLTVSNIVGPLMVYFDRFFIGAIAGMTAVAYYTTPYEVVTRLWIIPDALVGVLFTAFATALASDPKRARPFFDAATRLFSLIIGIPSAFIILFAHEALSLWLSPDFANESAAVLRVLAIGVFINCFARLPFSIIQANGQPDLTAKLHLAELPIYLLLLWILTNKFGVLGSAAIWTIRITGDTLILFLIGQRLVPELVHEQKRSLSIALFGGILLASFAFLDVLLLKIFIALLIAVLGIFFALKESRDIRTVLFKKKTHQTQNCK